MSQLFEDGKVINVDGAELECVGVSYQESDGERHSFGYTFRPKAEVDAEREAAAKAQEEADRLREAEESASVEVPAETITQPEPIKEETLNVR
jgi:hypothetical protein